MDIKELKHIHFVGIVGVGMTALALCAQDLGIKVTGSDTKDAFATDDILKKQGISWKVGFSEKNLEPRPDLVITTGAHGGFNNPEVVASKKLGIPVMSHAEALGEFAKGKDQIVTVGVGGKSTTAAMVAHILTFAGRHPSFAVGVGNIPSLGVSGKYEEESKEFVIEGDEFAISPGVDDRPRFSYLNPKVLIITNIEHDHPDIYPTLKNAIDVFTAFAEKVSRGGFLVANSDSENVRQVLKQLNVPVETFGVKSGDWKIRKVRFANQESFFTLTHGGLSVDMRLIVPGRFNMMNAVAAFIVCKGLGVPLQKIKETLVSFSGTKRRFEKIAEVDDILVFDDYAHHPTEIEATIEAAKAWFPKRRIISVFQPHTHTRTKALFSEFAWSFRGVAKAGFMDIYTAAREKADPNVSSKKLAEEAMRHGIDATYTEGTEGTINWLFETSKPGDVVLILGAGDIFLIIKDFVLKLKEKFSPIGGRRVDKFEKFKKNFQNAEENASFASLTTLGIGGLAKLVLVAENEGTFKRAVQLSRKLGIPCLVIGSGSDLLINDNGFDGLVIKNAISGVIVDKNKILAKGGSLLQELVDSANEHGLAGFEKMAGIPGTVAGAVYGNAGAYGQTVSDYLSRVRVYNGKRDSWTGKEDCQFGYRESIFKKRKDLFLLEVEFKSLEKKDSEKLKAISKETIKKRLEKWKPNIKTPGSFFKNVIAENLPKKVLVKIPADKIMYGKIPAGYLLEEVGAKGARRGNIQISPQHANLFINLGGGTAADFYSLAKEYRQKVTEKFGIALDPEVQLVGFEKGF